MNQKLLQLLGSQDFASVRQALELLYSLHDTIEELRDLTGLPEQISTKDELFSWAGGHFFYYSYVSLWLLGRMAELQVDWVMDLTHFALLDAPHHYLNARRDDEYTNSDHAIPEIFANVPIKHLDLSSTNIKKVPDFIQHMKLVSLDLSNNSFIKFSCEENTFVHLEKLILSKNKLEKVDIPKSSMCNLKQLIAEDMICKEFHLNFWNFPQVEEISFSHRVFKPEEKNTFSEHRETETRNNMIFNPSILSLQSNSLTLPSTYKKHMKRQIFLQWPTDISTHFPHLKKLRLQNCALQDIPEDIGNLSQLEHLDLYQNDIHQLPSGLAKLTNITCLELGYNKIQDMSPIQNCNKLRCLGLKGNQLTTFPPSILKLQNLQQLNIADNNITAIPKELYELPQLIKIDFWLNNLDPKEAKKIARYILKQHKKRSNYSEWYLQYVETYLENSIQSQAYNLLLQVPIEMFTLSRKHMSFSEKILTDTQYRKKITSLFTLLVCGFLVYIQNYPILSIVIVGYVIFLWTTLEEGFKKYMNLPLESQLDEIVNLEKLINKLLQTSHEEHQIYFDIEYGTGNNNPATSEEKNIAVYTNMQQDETLQKTSVSLGIYERTRQWGLEDNRLWFLQRGKKYYPTGTKLIDFLEILHLQKDSLEDRLSTIQSLDLSNCDLHHLPESISIFPNLHQLNLSFNKIRKLPMHLTYLPLQKIILHGTNIRLFPFEWIQKCKNIQIHDKKIHTSFFDCDNITTNNFIVPAMPHICNLAEADPDYAKTILQIDLSQTGLTQLPENIGSLRHLQRLDLSGTMLTKLPHSICELTHLRFLNLCQTHIQEFPTQLNALGVDEKQWFMVQNDILHMTNLRYLSLQKMELSNIPTQIEHLTLLRELNLSDNRITEIPPFVQKLTHLTQLKLPRNQIQQIPNFLLDLKHLHRVDLRNNQIISISEEMENQSNFELRLKKNPLTEQK